MSVFGAFLACISRIRTEYREILRISPYLVQMRENTDQKNSEYGHLSHSVSAHTTFPQIHYFLYKHEAYMHIEAEIYFKNKHI